MGKAFPKLETGQTKQARKPKQTPAPPAPATVVLTGPKSEGHYNPSMQHDINHVAGLSGIEASFDNLVDAVRRLTSDEHVLSISSGYGVNPLKLTLTGADDDDTTADLLSAVQRIADSLGKIAGLNRPRLERWYEQDEYEPRYKDVACDGGAPGPKTDKAA